MWRQTETVFYGRKNNPTLSSFNAVAPGLGQPTAGNLKFVRASNVMKSSHLNSVHDLQKEEAPAPTPSSVINAPPQTDIPNIYEVSKDGKKQTKPSSSISAEGMLFKEDELAKPVQNISSAVEIGQIIAGELLGMRKKKKNENIDANQKDVGKKEKL